MLSTTEMREILERVKYPEYHLYIVEQDGHRYMQGMYKDIDVDDSQNEKTVQKTRKWQLSPHMVPSEIVQTALKLVLTSAEHRVREHFTYRDERVFGPHFDVEALVDLCKLKKESVRS